MDYCALCYDVAEDFARRDPYVANDLVPRREVRPWAVGDDEPPAASAAGGKG